jgi:RNA polymerase sigma-70 factor (ECF subfamily)
MLPKSQRQAILLVGLEGMRYDEVARTLDVPVGTIRSRLSRGRAMLGKLMRGRREMTRRERRKPGYADRAA